MAPAKHTPSSPLADQGQPSRVNARFAPLTAPPGPLFCQQGRRGGKPLRRPWHRTLACKDSQAKGKGPAAKPAAGPLSYLHALRCATLFILFTLAYPRSGTFPSSLERNKTSYLWKNYRKLSSEVEMYESDCLYQRLSLSARWLLLSGTCGIRRSSLCGKSLRKLRPKAPGFTK